MLSFYLAMLDDDEDKAHFEILYKKYIEYVSKIARSLTDDDVIAMDSVQDTFVAIAKNIDKLSSITSSEFERRYIRKIILNSVSDQKRKVKGNSLPVFDVGIICDCDYIGLGEENEYLARLLEKLPPLYVDTMTLYYLDEMKVSDIAELFEISQFSVYSRLRRGTVMLKKLWEENDD